MKKFTLVKVSGSFEYTYEEADYTATLRDPKEMFGEDWTKDSLVNGLPMAEIRVVFAELETSLPYAPSEGGLLEMALLGRPPAKGGSSKRVMLTRKELGEGYSEMVLLYLDALGAVITGGFASIPLHEHYCPHGSLAEERAFEFLLAESARGAEAWKESQEEMEAVTIPGPGGVQ